MPSIKEYNDKIKSLNNTAKITKTMKMVSASKLKKAQEAQANAKLYAENLTALISRITHSLDESAHPLFEKRTEIKKALILIVTSDKGLCGAFNNNANKQVSTWIAQNEERLHQIDLSFCGKRGFTFFSRHPHIKKNYEDSTVKPDFLQAEKIGDELAESFISKEYDEVYIAYNQFFSPLSQKTLFEKILPIDPKALIKEEVALADQTEYLFEPKTQELLKFLIPHYLYFRIYFALLENSAGEHGARMTSMDSASKNAKDLIEKNTLLRNRARQAAITTELIEIVAGAEALN